jgi:hypothetical protein
MQMAVGPELIAEAGQPQVQVCGISCFLGRNKQEEKEGERRAMEGQHDVLESILILSLGSPALWETVKDKSCASSGWEWSEMRGLEGGEKVR